tara:strand:+ start:1297 stop:1773 length:477 start_codon:yes stop_codon:yes gene_type:complete
MKNIIITNKDEVKSNQDNIKDEYYDTIQQVPLVNRLFLNEDFEPKSSIRRELLKKLSSYRAQDSKKNRLNSNTFITYDELVEKLVVSKLKCHYCKTDMVILYKNKRESKQWTLDRVDNSIGHSSQNTVISCLACNLQKRRRDDNKFKFTKQMRLIKII